MPYSSTAMFMLVSFGLDALNSLGVKLFYSKPQEATLGRFLKSDWFSGLFNHAKSVFSQIQQSKAKGPWSLRVKICPSDS